MRQNQQFTHQGASKNRRRCSSISLSLTQFGWCNRRPKGEQTFEIKADLLGCMKRTSRKENVDPGITSSQNFFATSQFEAHHLVLSSVRKWEPQIRVDV